MTMTERGPRTSLPTRPTAAALVPTVPTQRSTRSAALVEDDARQPEDLFDGAPVPLSAILAGALPELGVRSR